MGSRCNISDGDSKKLPDVVVMNVFGVKSLNQLAAVGESTAPNSNPIFEVGGVVERSDLEWSVLTLGMPSPLSP